ncbi:MAG: hypothetical protein JSW47_12265 [Phycisphaerales bacterium]|nr:MAG: hypothetical protein JSW47_12265 [Phycisphaerales bacterium]
MRLKARVAEALLYWITVVALAGVVTGCGSKSAKLPTYMRPELLYLNDQPYSRLYVEVDSVEDVKVSEELLDDLRVFLARYCSKPSGIEIVRDQPVALSEIRDMPMGAASILCLDGPDPNSGPQPAYLHLFFYDTKTSFKRTLKNPHTLGLCPSAICYNVDYCRSRQDEVGDFILKHEVGHVLGLSKNTAHSDGAHCTNHACLMNASPGWWSGFFGLLLGVRIRRELCADCRDDLERWRSEDVDPELAFKGPFLARREKGYSIACLPYCDLIIPAALEDDFDWREALAKLKEEIRGSDYGEHWRENAYMRGLCRPDDTEEPPESMIDYLDIFAKAVEDPNPFVKRYAIAELARIKKGQDK